MQTQYGLWIVTVGFFYLGDGWPMGDRSYRIWSYKYNWISYCRYDKAVCKRICEWMETRIRKGLNIGMFKNVLCNICFFRYLFLYSNILCKKCTLSIAEVVRFHKSLCTNSCKHAMLFGLNSCHIISGKLWFHRVVSKILL